MNKNSHAHILKNAFNHLLSLVKQNKHSREGVLIVNPCRLDYEPEPVAPMFTKFGVRFVHAVEAV